MFEQTIEKASEIRDNIVAKVNELMTLIGSNTEKPEYEGDTRNIPYEFAGLSHEFGMACLLTDDQQKELDEETSVIIATAMSGFEAKHQAIMDVMDTVNKTLKNPHPDTLKALSEEDDIRCHHIALANEVKYALRSVFSSIEFVPKGVDIQIISEIDELIPSHWMNVLKSNSRVVFEANHSVKFLGTAYAFCEAIIANKAITLVSMEDAWDYIFEHGLARIMSQVPSDGVVSTDKHEEIRAWVCETFRVILKDEALKAFDNYMNSKYAKLRGEDDDADY